jgi:hypothetical protein
MTAVNAGLTAASAANNAAAQSAAHRARVDRCTVFESRFEVARASVAEKQEYASCVETLYPMPVTEGETSLIKACIVVLLIAMVLGIIWGWRDSRDWEGPVLCGLMFPVFAALAMFIIGLIILGVEYLFT